MKKLFGGGKVKPVNPSEVIRPFNAGGVSGGFNRGGELTLTPSEARKDLITKQQGQFTSLADFLRSNVAPATQRAFDSAISTSQGLIDRVRPGFGDLTTATKEVFSSARDRLRNRLRSSQGDLRENLNKRRVSGASFAEDLLTRQKREFEGAEAELTAQENEALARSTLEELDATTRLIDRDLGLKTAAVNASLDNFTKAISAEAEAIGLEKDEMDKLLAIATDLVGNATASFSQLAGQQRELAAENARGFGKFLGTAGSIALAPVTGGASLMALPAFTGQPGPASG